MLAKEIWIQIEHANTNYHDTPQQEEETFF